MVKKIEGLWDLGRKKWVCLRNPVDESGSLMCSSVAGKPTFYH